MKFSCERQVVDSREAQYNRRLPVSAAEVTFLGKEWSVQYWVKIVFVDNQELMVNDAVRHTISDDMEVLEVDSAREVLIIPMKQIKYLACDATVFATKPKT